MKKILLAICTSLVLASCATKPVVIYKMPEAPPELLTPTQSLKEIKPYKSELGLVPANPK